MLEATKRVKKNQKSIIQYASDDKGMEDSIYYTAAKTSGEKIGHDICFARLGSDLKRRGDINFLHFLLRVDMKKEEILYFNMKRIFEDLNEMFGNVFQIKMFKSGVEDVRIVEIKEIDTFSDKVLYSAYLLLLSILRGMDGEFLSRWRTLSKYEDFPKNKITNITDMIYWYHMESSGNSNHVFNDTLYSAWKNRDPDLVLYKALVRKYVRIIKGIFGKGSKVDLKDKKILSRLNVDDSGSGWKDYKMQTPTINMLEEIVTELYGGIQ
jgi:hypothetical protein